MLTQIYHTTVTWKEGHLGHLSCGNGSEMNFSAPADSHGIAGVITPEDAFVGALNMCIMLMFLWAADRLKIDLLSYECKAEGEKRIELDKTEVFTRVTLRPKIKAVGSEERVLRALESARKYSLVASSVKAEVLVEPEITIVQEERC